MQLEYKVELTSFVTKHRASSSKAIPFFSGLLKASLTWFGGKTATSTLHKATESIRWFRVKHTDAFYHKFSLLSPIRKCIFHKYVLNRIGFTGGEELHFNLLKDSVILPLAFIFRIFVFIHFFVFWRGKSNHRIRKVVKKVTMPARKKKSLVRKCRSILCWLADDPFDVDV